MTVAPGTKLESGPATLHLCNDVLVVARDVPPAVMGQWKLSDLRRYGAVPNGFIFEGGTRCGYCKYAGPWEPQASGCSRALLPWKPVAWSLPPHRALASLASRGHAGSKPGAQLRPDPRCFCAAQGAEGGRTGTQPTHRVPGARSEACGSQCLALCLTSQSPRAIHVPT